jgi:predicted glycogen debranching enzyme
VTNGLGGFGCGTVAGANTRRYHGLLVAACKPPVERTLLVAKVDAAALYLGTRYDLSANEFEDGTVSPPGFVHIESFAVVDGIPTWRYALADALLELRVFMAPGANTSYQQWELVRASAPLQLELKPFVTHRDFHAQGRGARAFRLDAGDGACLVHPPDGADAFSLSISSGHFAAAGEWYWNFLHRREAERGLDAVEDLWMPGLFTAVIEAPERVFFVAAAGSGTPPAGVDVLSQLQLKARRLTGALPPAAPEWVRQLAVAADQFIVRRGTADEGHCSVIAGYPWFADWGRDSMISLPGLATALGRFDVAADLFRTYAGFVDGGLLPNRLPDESAAPQYNTADATLWMFHALDDYFLAKNDPALVRELFPVLFAIIHAHVDGTRHGIQVDPVDGLLRAGEPGLQLTWMDAKQGDTVFTPRIGKPVEINALWLNALAFMARLAARRRESHAKRYCQDLLRIASTSFMRYWNPEKSCLYDVIDVDGGSGRDARLRPNQLFAVSLPFCVLAPEQRRAVVDACGRALLTSYGLRSLAPTEDGYIGAYRGDPWQRDAAYHQGTAWSWLLGPFAWAHFRAYGDARRAQALLAPMAQHLEEACVGTVSELFDGDAPHAPRGCIAQAWGVAETLRIWIRLEREAHKT